MRQAIEWTRSRLDQESLDFLAAVPPAIKTEQLLFTHAEALELSRFDGIDSVEKARANFAPSDHHITFVGHGHHPTVFVLNEDGTVEELPARDCRLLAGKRYIVNVGSVGQPRDGDPRACYTILHDGRVTFHRVEYDLERTIAKIYPIPELDNFLGDRLRDGR